jgi:hypothetical protein
VAKASTTDKRPEPVLDMARAIDDLLARFWAQQREGAK